jgi:hypothetical protein
MRCPASVSRSRSYLKTSTQAAEVGTRLHELAGDALKKDKDTYEYHNVSFANGIFELDDDSRARVQCYLNFVRRLESTATVRKYIESELASNRHENFYGSVDYAQVDDLGHAGVVIHVVDLKTGVRPVVAENNYQLVYYAALILDDLPEALRKRVRRIHMHIFQTPAGYDVSHSQWDLSPVELEVHVEELLSGIARAYAKTPQAEAGEQCTYCPCRADCREYREYVTESSGFEILTQKNAALPAISELTPVELSRILSSVELLQEFARLVKSEAATRLLRGETIPGYKLTDGRRRKAWKDLPDLDAKLDELLGAEAFTRKPKTPTQVGKLVGLKAIADLYETRASQPVLTTNMFASNANITSVDGFDTIDLGDSE